MSFFSFSNISVKGFSAAVPSRTVNNCVPGAENYEEMIKFSNVTGVEQRRISRTLTASDLCFHATELIMRSLDWSADSIDVLIFVSEGRDYSIPSTASLLQKRLNLSEETYCVDLTLGCSGWVYGFNYACSLLSSGSVKRALLLNGASKEFEGIPVVNLFGHAGCVTAIEYDEGKDGCIGDFGTVGSMYDSIIVPDGATRNTLTLNSWDEIIDFNGQKRNRLQLSMKGLNVFSFSVKEVPQSVIRLAEHFDFDYKDCDYLVLHQANKTINDAIIKSLRFPIEKCPFSISMYGNTSSASIPLTIVSQLKGKVENKKTKFLCSGFGVGLSWGTVAFSTENLIIPDMIEIQE